MKKLKREIKLLPAWDKRDPNPSKNYGIHSMNLVMYVIGGKGAIQFVVYTNCHLRHVEQEMITSCDGRFCRLKPLPADIGYHAKIAQYDGQEPTQENCKLTNGVCYYDGSSLYAEELYYDIFVPKGSDAMFEKMEEIYYERFNSHD